MEFTPEERKSFLFTRLVLMFQTAAMQQLGKLADPFSGKIVRDLPQAALSIDTLDMLREKCRAALNPEEERLLEHISAELKLNYVDESHKPDPAAEGDKPTSSDSSAVK